jgi:putative hydrolase of the HAD superfamily
MKLSDHKILTFDIVGTLIDFEAGVVNYIGSVAKETALELDSATILTSFAKAESELHVLTPGISFTEMLPDIYKKMSIELGLRAAASDIEGLRLSIPYWPAFPDSIEALKILKKRYRLVATTNVDNWSVAQFSRTLEEPFDDTVTAEDVESCKPDPQFFAYTRGRESHKGYRLNDYLHVAQSQFHDIGIAKQLGYRVCWIERRHDQQGFGGSPTPPNVTKPDYHFHTLAELAAAVLSDAR